MALKTLNMLDYSSETVWVFAKKSDQFFLSNSENINNPIVRYQAVLVGCAITILIIREKMGVSASNSLVKFFRNKLCDYLESNPDLQDFATDDEELENQINTFVAVLSSGNGSHMQALANNLYLDPEDEINPVDLLSSIKRFLIALKGYKKMILDNISI